MSSISEDPLHGNHASDLLDAALAATQPVSDPHTWQPPSPEFLQSMLPGYLVEGFLARGGMGAVYRGVQISLSRKVAIKILPPQLLETDSSFAERFKQEAKAMAQLNHPGIVSVYDFGEMQDGTLYFIMEFVDGTDVGQMVAQQGRLPSAHAMAITAHVCDALQYAHERGVVHRDIKPANIMVGYDGSVKVADFGLAKSALQRNTSLTVSGHVMGTPHFVAPEALMLGSSVDHRADIYAVGVMLYQMLTGKIPQGLFEMPSMQVPGLDPRYDAIIAGAMREDRELRYQHIQDMRRALDAIVTQPVERTEVARTAAPSQSKPGKRAPVQPYRPPARSIPPQPPKKKSASGWIAAVFVTVLAAGGFVLLKPNPPPQSANAKSTLSPEPPKTTQQTAAAATAPTDPLTSPTMRPIAPVTREDFSVMVYVTIFGVTRDDAAGFLSQSRLKSDPGYIADNLTGSAVLGRASVVANLAVSSRFGQRCKVNSHYSLEAQITAKERELTLNLDLSSLHPPVGSRLQTLDRPVKRGETIYLGSFDEDAADPALPVRIAFLTLR